MNSKTEGDTVRDVDTEKPTDARYGTQAKRKIPKLWLVLGGLVGVAVINGLTRSPTSTSASNTSASNTRVSEGLIVTTAFAACRSKDDFERLMRLAHSKDKEAFGTMWRSFIVAGRCKLLEKGTHVREEERDAWAGGRCVAAWGSSEPCYWTYDGAFNG